MPTLSDMLTLLALSCLKNSVITPLKALWQLPWHIMSLASKLGMSALELQQSTEKLCLSAEMKKATYKLAGF